ncbi:MAG: hypothetical protein HPY55_12615 [Firmicutes bacterium]|nr:hypothetical protein [Bacillota bacterium]
MGDSGAPASGHKARTPHAIMEAVAEVGVGAGAGGAHPLWWSESWSIDALNDEVYDDEAWPEQARAPEPPD